MFNKWFAYLYVKNSFLSLAYPLSLCFRSLFGFSFIAMITKYFVWADVEISEGRADDGDAAV